MLPITTLFHHDIQRLCSSKKSNTFRVHRATWLWHRLITWLEKWVWLINRVTKWLGIHCGLTLLQIQAIMSVLKIFLHHTTPLASAVALCTQTCYKSWSFYLYDAKKWICLAKQLFSPTQWSSYNSCLLSPYCPH